jgi:hypothetical protein
VAGIEAAIRQLGRGAHKVSIFVFGDEFTGSSIEDVIEAVDRLNAKDKGGARRVRIHALGFPTLFSQGAYPENTTVRFAMLMRALCEKNGGTFIGLNSLSP